MIVMLSKSVSITILIIVTLLIIIFKTATVNNNKNINNYFDSCSNGANNFNNTDNDENIIIGCGFDSCNKNSRIIEKILSEFHR